MKKNYFVMIALVLSVWSANAQVDLNSGLVGYYPFNGTANDATGNGNNGVNNGATLTTDRFGNINSAYSFNGVDNYIKVTNASGFSNSNYTYSVWVNMDELPVSYDCNFVLELGDSNISGQCLAVNNNYPSINQTTGWSINSPNGLDGATRVNFQTGNLPEPNAWYNITVVRNDTSVIVYENGKQIKYVLTNASVPYYSDPTNLYIGARAQMLSNFFFNGTIDDVRIYDRAINIDEINALYNESICYQSVTVTDTLIINVDKITYNPITYANTIKIYPNPAKDLLTIHYGDYNSLQGYTLKFISSIGQTVFASQINKQESTIDLTGLAKGLYFVHLIDSQGNTIEVRKIVLK